MTLLDPYTLATVTCLIGLYLAVNMLGIRMAGTRHRAVLFWAGAGLLLAFGYQFGRLALVDGASAINPRFSIALANVGIIGSHCMLLLGFQIYFSQRPWFWVVTSIMLFLLIGGLAWPPMYSDAVFRIGVLTLIELVVLGGAVRLLWTCPRPFLRKHCRIIAVIISAHLCLLILRWGFLFMGTFDRFGEGKTFLVVPLFFSSMVFYMLMSLMLAQLLFRHKESQLQALALLDPLTGLQNRRLLERQIQRQINQAQQKGKSFSLLMLDLDHFKALNDRYGHGAGDEALVQCAWQLRKATRENDLLFRAGGEEFLVLMPNVGSAQAMAVAKHILESFQNLKISYRSDQISLTASIGVTSFGPGMNLTVENILRKTDESLYLAKKSGRNQIASFSDLQES